MELYTRLDFNATPTCLIEFSFLAAERLPVESGGDHSRNSVQIAFRMFQNDCDIT